MLSDSDSEFDTPTATPLRSYEYIQLRSKRTETAPNVHSDDYKLCIKSTNMDSNWPQGLGWAWPTINKTLRSRTKVSKACSFQLLLLMEASNRYLHLQADDAGKFGNVIIQKRMAASTVMHSFKFLVIEHMAGMEYEVVDFDHQADADAAHTRLVGTIDNMLRDGGWRKLCNDLYLSTPYEAVEALNRAIDCVVLEYVVKSTARTTA